jgi:Myosin-like coiled-coil protein
MSKKIVNLEKETHSWKSRWEKSHQALIEMAADKQKKDEEFALASKQVMQLQKLCRTLQEERGKQQAKLKDCKFFLVSTKNLLTNCVTQREKIPPRTNPILSKTKKLNSCPKRLSQCQ